jgi:flagellar biogenesis protein FliO
MFDSLFGSEPSVVKFVIAFVVVIALIALAAWLVRRFGAARLGNGATRGRQPRLAVIDAASVDGRRRLVLIRRDNIEHLLMIGGPTDVVIEPNIVRATTRDTSRQTTAETSGRSQPADIATSWPLQPSVEPAVAAAPARHLRATFGDETHWNANDASHESAPEPAREPSRARPDSLTGMATGLAADLSARLNPPVEPSFGRHAPPEPPHTTPVAAPPVEPARRFVPESDFDSRRSDRNLAEMASRLEAALRRPPPLPEGRPPVTDALAFAPEPKAPAPKIPAAEPRASELKPPPFAAAPKAKAPDVKAPDVKAPETATSQAAAPQVTAPPAAVPQVTTPRAATPHVKAPDIKAPELKAPDIKPAAAPSVASERLPTADSKAAAPAPAAKAASKPASQPASKSIYDNLEQEMASLLGRPANK